MEEKGELFADLIRRVSDGFDAMEGSDHWDSAASWIGWGWLAHLVGCARAAEVLHAAGLGNEAAPLRRSALDYGSALAWLNKMRQGAVEAVTWDARRRHRKYLSVLQAAGFELDDTLGLSEGGPGPEPPGARLLTDHEARCKNLESPSLHAAWVHESKIIHPTLVSAANYAPAPGFVLHARMPDSAVSLGAYVICLALGFDAMASLTKDDRFASILRDIEQTTSQSVSELVQLPAVEPPDDP